MNGTEIKYGNIKLRGWPFSLDLTNKGHPIAKRVWTTYDSMMDYILDPNSSAVSGIILVVTEDPDETKRGSYLVKQIANDRQFHETIVVKLATREEIKISKLSQGSLDAGVTLENEVLDIPDMRTYWSSDSFN